MNYFDRFGVPRLSRHALGRLMVRDVTLAMLDEALRTTPVSGTKPGTLWFRGGGVTVVVNATTGQMITMWRPSGEDR